MAVPAWATTTMEAALAVGIVTGKPPLGAGRKIRKVGLGVSVRLKIRVVVPVHLSKKFT